MTKPVHIQSIFQMILELLAQKDMEINEAFADGMEMSKDKQYYSGREEGYEEGYDDGFQEAYDQGYESGVEHAEEVYSKGYADGLAYAYKSAEDTDFEVFDDGIKQGFDNACIAMSKYANKLIEDTSDEEEDD